MEITVQFPGGVAVDAVFGGFTVHTDQPVTAGGGGTGPSPFDMFLASLATCAGFYALRFCQERKLSVEGLGVTLTTVRDPERKRLASIKIEVRLPREFPDKYREAILRAVDQCAVKKHVLEPPVFEMTAV